MIQITAQVGEHLRWEEDGAHGGYEEDLGLHQEKQPQSGGYLNSLNQFQSFRLFVRQFLGNFQSDL